jgi:hypothetical protein
MNKRRQILLLGVLGLIVAFYVGDWLFQTILDGPRKERLNRKAQLEKKLEERKADLLEAIRAGKELESWEARSLPSDPEIAVSLYRSWLTELVSYARFDDAYVDAGSPMDRRGLYRTIDFSIRANGTLEQLTTFLFEFYNAGHLHQIRSINITPLPARDELDLAISIETLLVPTADRTNELTTVTVDRLAFDSLSDYQLINQRNLFGFSSRGIHPTDQTFLTAVVQVDGQPQAWFSDRTTDSVYRLTQGDELAVGQFHGNVQEIDSHDVILESDGERWLMSVGESLAQAVALPPEY